MNAPFPNPPFAAVLVVRMCSVLLPFALPLRKHRRRVDVPNAGQGLRVVSPAVGFEFERVGHGTTQISGQFIPSTKE